MIILTVDFGPVVPRRRYAFTTKRLALQSLRKQWPYHKLNSKDSFYEYDSDIAIHDKDGVIRCWARIVRLKLHDKVIPLHPKSGVTTLNYR